MKYILVTGAYGGMGMATAEKFARAGFCVLALDRKVGNAEENIIPIEADVTSEESVKHAAEEAHKYTDSIFAVIHFAGVYMLDSLAEMSAERFERIFRINLFGAFCVNRTFLPFLSSGSRIIMTTSELAPLDPLPFTGIYAISKSALDKYAYSLRMELQLLGISVSVLRAGAVKTDMLGASTAALDRFCSETALYSCNAARFRKIVDGVEAKCVPPEKIADKMLRITEKKHPRVCLYDKPQSPAAHPRFPAAAPAVLYNKENTEMTDAAGGCKNAFISGKCRSAYGRPADTAQKIKAVNLIKKSLFRRS